MADALRAAAYCRVSTNSEAQQASLREQRAFFADYAARSGLTLVEVYADGGVSGTRLTKRKAFLRMMADAEAGRFRLLLVKDISRMARNVLDFLTSIRQLKAWGVECRFINGGLSAGDGELFLTILAAVAQEESANLSKRVKFTKQHHAALGRVPSRVYGYAPIAGDAYRLAVKENEAAVVRRIYRLAAEGLGSRRIARELAAEGHELAESRVRYILRSPLYKGQLRTHQTEVADFLTGRRVLIPEAEQYVFWRTELAIVTEDVWQAAQRPPQSRQASTSGLTGRIVCGVCGRPFRMRRQKNGRVWLCGTRDRLGSTACANRMRIREDDLFEELRTVLDCELTRGEVRRLLRQADCSAMAAAAWLTEEERLGRWLGRLTVGADGTISAQLI